MSVPFNSLVIRYQDDCPLLFSNSNQVEFKVNGVKQDYSMKLGEGGEAFFVFETSDEIPEALQTSPLVSPTTSPQALSAQDPASAVLQEPDYLDLTTVGDKKRPRSSVLQGKGLSASGLEQRAQSELGMLIQRRTLKVLY